MQIEEYLRDVKPGDLIIVIGYSYGAKKNERVCSIERVTPKRVVVNGDMYNRETGRRCGDYYGIRLEYPSPERVKKIQTEIRRRDLAGRLRLAGERPDSLTLDQLERIGAILDEADSAALAAKE